jgi:hypothetical protein
MKYARTFKLFPRSIELRAYLPNNLKVSGVTEAAQKVAGEMLDALKKPYSLEDLEQFSDHLTVSSNRAGLHLAYWHEVGTPGSTLEQHAADWSTTIKQLVAAGWKECKGD